VSDGGAGRPWWDPERHRDRRGFLIARQRLMADVRAWFAREDFLEVDTAALQVSPGNEAHLHAFQTAFRPEGNGAALPLYLHTSPEFACKKLLAAGEARIFSLQHCYRNREVGPLHHPEFMMLEWYRAETDYHAMMADCAALLVRGAEALGVREVSYRGRVADVMAEARKITVAEAFQAYAGVDLLATVRVDDVDRDALAREALRLGLHVADDDTWSDVFSRILATRVEPQLGLGRADILYEYPTVEAALARRTLHDPRVAERFEMYLCGVELANAFSELTDAGEQRRRFEVEMAEKARVYGERYPLDEAFLTALAVMPAASGCALGFDRLLMLLSGAERIDQVIWTPVI
jgi:elongation factor P--(R)-beta-lysine ligase